MPVAIRADRIQMKILARISTTNAKFEVFAIKADRFFGG